MKIKLNKNIFILFIFVNAQWADAANISSDSLPHKGIPKLQIDNSFYFLDKRLVGMGYSLANYQNKPILLRDDRPMRMASSPFSHSPIKKLYIQYNDSLQNSSIYLDDKYVGKNTDQKGNAIKDLYKSSQDILWLSLRNSKSRKELCFIFSHDVDMKIICSGINKFDCRIQEY